MYIEAQVFMVLKDEKRKWTNLDRPAVELDKLSVLGL